MDKKIWIGFGIFTLILILSSLAFYLMEGNSLATLENSSPLNKESITETAEIGIKDGIIDAEKEEINEVEDIFEKSGISGMRIISSKINGEEYKELTFDNSDLSAENQFIKKGDTVEQIVTIDNKLGTKLNNVSTSTLVKIDYNKIYWNGSSYDLTDKPIKIEGVYRDGKLADASIWFGDRAEKQIFFKDWIEKGGYALAYNNGSDNLIDFKIDGFDIKAFEKFSVDPTFINITDGFLTTGDGSANGVDIWGNDTTLFIADTTDGKLYHYLNDGTYIKQTTAPGSFRGVCGNDTNYIAIAIGGADFFVYDYQGNAITSYTNGANAQGNGNVNGMWCNETSILVSDYSDEMIYHTLIDGTYVGKYSVGYTSTPQGLTDYNSSTLFVVDQGGNYIYETNRNLTLLKNYTLNDIGVYLTNTYGIWGNGTDYWMLDGTGRVFHIFNQTVYVDETPQFALNNPSDYSNFSTTSATFNCSANSTRQLLNLTLLIDGEYNLTVYNTTINQNLSLETDLLVAEGSHNWSCYASTNNVGADSPTRYFNIDLSSPVIANIWNVTNLLTTSLPVNSTWNYSVSDLTLDSCWFRNETGINESVSCNLDLINDTQWGEEGLHNITMCANDTFARTSCNLSSFEIFSYAYSSTDLPDPTSEGNTVTYQLQLNVSNTGRWDSTNASLVFNSTLRSSAVTTTYPDYFLFTDTKFIEDGLGNTTGYNYIYNWTFNLQNSSTKIASGVINGTTTVYSLAIDDCKANTIRILNITLYDEELLNTLNETAENIDLEIDLLLSKGNQTWQHSQDYTNYSVNVCVNDGSINFSNYTIDFTIGFSGDSYVWEFFYLDNGTLDNENTLLNTWTNKTLKLYDLNLSDSTSFLFNYFDEDGLEVEDALIQVYRRYIGSGIYREVERAREDDNGDTTVHLVEEDVIYYFIVTKNSELLFTSTDGTALCQQVPCTIQLEASGEFVEFGEEDEWDLIPNGSYNIITDEANRVVNLTFALSTSGKMNMSIYEYNSEGVYNLIGEDSDNSTSGILSVEVPLTAGNKTYYALIYKDDEFIDMVVVDLEEDAGLFFGNTLALFLGFLIILCLVLMAVSEGGGVIVFLILGLIFTSMMGLIDFNTPLGVGLIIYFAIAGAIILWKLNKRRRF